MIMMFRITNNLIDVPFQLFVYHAGLLDKQDLMI